MNGNLYDVSTTGSDQVKSGRATGTQLLLGEKVFRANRGATVGGAIGIADPFWRIASSFPTTTRLVTVEKAHGLREDVVPLVSLVSNEALAESSEATPMDMEDHTEQLQAKIESLNNMIALLSELRDLVLRKPNEELGFMPPTEHTIGVVLPLLTAASKHMEHPFPYAEAAPDEDGELEIYWRKPKRKVHLVIPPSKDRPGYIYYREDTSYGLDHDISPKRLAHWLDWYASI